VALQKIIISPKSSLYLWNITESLTGLLSLLTKSASNEYLRYRSPEHQKQYLAKKILLQYLSIEDKLSYLDSGKPVLNNNQHISISHSGNWVVISIASQETGIDMESANPKLLKIASKFVHPSEKNIFETGKTEDLQFIWTAKESIYKLAGQKGLSFKNDIILHQFDRKKKMAYALLHQKKKIKIFFNKINPNLIISQAFFDK